MATAKELRQHCDQLRIEREEELKSALNDYFESTFMVVHRPFRAVIGNKKCKPIPIYRDFLAFYEGKVIHYKIQWPNFPEELLRKELENLGFIITENKISISVPPYKKGTKLSFAQECVKKVNASYSDYCAKERQIAKELYSEFVSALLSTPDESILTYDEYTLFCDFRFDCIVSSKYAKFMRKLMARDGIEEYYEDGEYKGVKVYSTLPN